MSRDYRVYLDDMLTCVEKAIRYTRGLEFAGFIADEKTYDGGILPAQGRPGRPRSQAWARL